MIVVTNRIAVAEGHEIDFEERFQNRLHLVDQHPGFLRNEVHRPRPMRFDRDQGRWVDDPLGQGVYEVKTWWESLEAFTDWVHSEDFRRAHSNRPPKEMFRAPNELTVHEIVTSSDLKPSPASRTPQ